MAAGGLGEVVPQLVSVLNHVAGARAAHTKVERRDKGNPLIARRSGVVDAERTRAGHKAQASQSGGPALGDGSCDDASVVHAKLVDGRRAENVSIADSGLLAPPQVLRGKARETAAAVGVQDGGIIEVVISRPIPCALV